MFFETMTVRLDQADARAVDALADRLQLPSGAVARLLLRAGLEALHRDGPGAILGAPTSSAPGLPLGTRTRSGGAA